jgi:hypothetical protein
MTDTKSHSAAVKPGSLEGRVFKPQSMPELVEAVELAFDYRGDITIQLKSGESLAGYLFNREASGPGAWLEIFPVGSAEIRRLCYDEVATIAFSGEDTAAGNSWETWVAKKESERKAEASRVAAEAQARGHL